MISTEPAQHYVLTGDPLLPRVISFIKNRELSYEIHINRIRFWVPRDTSVYTEFLLQFADHCPPVTD